MNKYINGMTTVEYLEQAKLNIQVTLLISSVRDNKFRRERSVSTLALDITK